MYRLFTLTAIVLALTLGGCGRHSDTNEPDAAKPAAGDTATESMREPVPAPTEENGTGKESESQMDSGMGSEMESGSGMESDEMGSHMGGDTGTDTTICTPEWFAWVHQQVIGQQDGKMTELYPNGLPEVGTDEWFIAVDKLTGGDGAHGPDGGSEEWCNMIQQRLGKSSTDDGQ
ncbi:hypothetical protein [Microbulbifer hainanensis]|uniref:hypothetical protein n=1 Tax=Microbulbifer hainanensis TaxID=2735675 RepID=UPI00186645DE|nr:hypothetical protein [Microbulbifer hainanensis]